MASVYPPTSSAASHAQRGGAHGSPAPPASTAPQGTFLPGTKVQVGSHRVTIEKYLSEGGFAHVYLVRIPRDNHKHEQAVLKRVAVPDKEHLASMRTEVETMKKLTGHKHVVTYIDSHASPLHGGGYEVFLLMEYCSGGGLIDFMNTRLQHRLTEPEILKIFGDVAEGVACMHYLKPPLLHRDLKVENVLISASASTGTPVYKICDFGSTAPPRPAAKTTEEGRLIEEDVQQHTTMQYRSPEMIDVWRKQPIDEKADIWALGVLLYKLCYYTTPFEDVGQMAILNASFKYPSHPSFSAKVKKLIGWMLMEDPKQRPNIYQVIKETCNMRGTEVPIKDIYANRTQSEARNNEALPSPRPAVGLQKQAPEVKVQKLPEVTPMRRGRPTAPTQPTTAAVKPKPSPSGNDPFAALDSKNFSVRAGAVDELSQRFPSLDDFSITHEKGGTFAFADQERKGSKDAKAAKLNDQVTKSLADAVFGQSQAKTDLSRSQSTTQLERSNAPSASSADLKTNEPLSSSASLKSKAPDVTKPRPRVHEPAPARSGILYTDTAVGSSPPPSTSRSKFPEVSTRPIWRVPDSTRSSSQPRDSDAAQATTAALQPPSQNPALLSIHRSKSQTAQTSSHSSTSSRPSLEGHRPTPLDLPDETPARTKSAQSRQRPSSVYVTSNLEYLRDQEISRKRPSMEGRRHSRQPSYNPELGSEEVPIDDDIDFLRNSETGDLPPRKSNGSKSASHKSRASLSNARNIFGGRFSDAFKRFESNGPDDHKPDIAIVTPELGHKHHQYDDDEPALLSPIQGSEATPSKHSDPDSAIDETQELPQDVRRELERRRLSDEERRVAEATAEYRSRVAAQGAGEVGIPSRASTIQKRVQSLLDDGRQSPAPYKRTAEGYGRYTDTSEIDQQRSVEVSQAAVPKTAAPVVARKPVINPELSGTQYPKIRQQVTEPAPFVATAKLGPQPARVVSRPSVPPKSQALRTGGSGRGQWPPSSQPALNEKPLPPKPSSGLAALLAKDLEGVPDYPPRGSSMTESVNTTSSGPARSNNAYSPAAGQMIASADDDMEADFSKRYPSLAGIDMVETEITGQRQQLRMREV